MKIIALFTIIFSSMLVHGEGLSSPESTLQGYLGCFQTSDEKCVLAHYHGIKSFYTGKPRSTDFEITNKIIYLEQDAKKWNDYGIVPSARAGDVELEVLQKTGNIQEKYSYNLRKFGSQWLIYSHAAWVAP